MKTRVLSAMVALPIVFVAFYIGGLAAYSLIVIASILGIIELTRAFKVNNNLKPLMITIIASLVYQTLVFYGNKSALPYIIGIYYILINIVYVIDYPNIKIKHILVNSFAFFYISFLLSYALMILASNEISPRFIWLVILVPFANDSFAYLFGKKLGKRKLAPVLSPNKTIEGAIGGIIGVCALIIIFSLFIVEKGFMLNARITIFLLLFAVISSLVAQVGDLAASAIKREQGIKDFGNLIPGHGGIMDRLDSIVLVAPVIYYMLIIINLIK